MFESKVFLLDLVERAGKTFAQSLLAALTVTLTLTGFDWKAALGVAGVATLASVLTTVASLPVGANGTGSLVLPAPRGQHEAPPAP